LQDGFLNFTNDFSWKNQYIVCVVTWSRLRAWSNKLRVTEKFVLKIPNQGREGEAGSDPSKRGRSPVVLGVLFHSRVISTRGIQSEIVRGYLHYLGFCTVQSGVVHSLLPRRNMILNFEIA